MGECLRPFRRLSRAYAARTGALEAREIRQVAADALDCFRPPRDPRILPRPTQEFAYLYMWIGCQWVAVGPKADANWSAPEA